MSKSDQPGDKPDHGGEKHTVTVNVFYPPSTTPKGFTWPKTMKVGEAAVEAAQECNIQVESPTFQNADSQVLDRQKPLIAEGVKDGDNLDLVSMGGGV